MSGHTEGPWVIGARSCEWNSPSSPYLHVDGERGPLIAKVRLRQDMDTLGGEECLANARLIAAAPDLLASLHELHDILHEWMAHNTGTRELDALERCEAAIAKAEGR